MWRTLRPLSTLLLGAALRRVEQHVPSGAYVDLMPSNHNPDNLPNASKETNLKHDMELKETQTGQSNSR